MASKGTSLRKYALVRLALVVPLIFIVLTLVFLLMRVAPGDPISASLGGHAPQSQIDEIKAELGYDEPLLEAVLRVSRTDRAREPRHDDHRPAAGHGHRP
jgi:ABC-type dipeptide/oligopeptide/nickel transport system permease component